MKLHLLYSIRFSTLSISLLFNPSLVHSLISACYTIMLIQLRHVKTFQKHTVPWEGETALHVLWFHPLYRGIS